MCSLIPRGAAETHLPRTPSASSLAASQANTPARRAGLLSKQSEYISADFLRMDFNAEIDKRSRTSELTAAKNKLLTAECRQRRQTAKALLEVKLRTRSVHY